MKKLRHVALVLLVCPLLLASCSGADSARTGGNPIIRAMADEPGLSQYQVGLLSDGELMFSEYEQAIFRAVKCLEDSGFIDVVTELESETVGYTIDFGYPGPTITAVDEAKRDGCFEDSLSAVEIAFAEQNRPSVEETELLLLRQYDCAREILLETGDYNSDELEVMTDEFFAEAASIDAPRIARCSRQS